jgi:hypothetical protein
MQHIYSQFRSLLWMVYVTNVVCGDEMPYVCYEWGAIGVGLN